MEIKAFSAFTIAAASSPIPVTASAAPALMPFSASAAFFAPSGNLMPKCPAMSVSAVPRPFAESVLSANSSLRFASTSLTPPPCSLVAAKALLTLSRGLVIFFNASVLASSSPCIFASAASALFRDVFHVSAWTFALRSDSIISLYSSLDLSSVEAFFSKALFAFSWTDSASETALRSSSTFFCCAETFSESMLCFWLSASRLLALSANCASAFFSSESKRRSVELISDTAALYSCSPASLICRFATGVAINYTSP